MQHETRNLILAVLLSIVVMGLWQYFVVEPQIQAQRAALEEKAKQAETLVAPTITPQTTKSREEVLRVENQRVRIDTPTLQGSLRARGARFDDLTLAGYRIALEEDAPEVPLLSPASSDSVYFAELGWLTADGKTVVPDKQTIWGVDSNALTPESPLTLRWTNDQGVEFIQQITIDERYLFTVTQEIRNQSAVPVAVSPYGLVNRTKNGERGLMISHEGAFGAFGGVLEEMTYDELEEDGPFRFEDTTGWLGLADQYWMTTFVPDNELTFNATAKEYVKNNAKRYQVDFVAQPVTIQPGGSHVVTQRLYAGAKKADWIDEYQERFDVTLFDRTIDYGWLYILTKPLYHILMFFRDLLGSVGLAILALTVCVKAVLFPLANKSYRSMGRMRLIMPEVMELREKYKDNPMDMNQKMMELYKRKKVNPASGCLPILLQIPIFFALYKMLYVTIELRHQPFYGWVSDLSAPDPTSIFQLFGLLTWDVPAWLPDIGVWPILFGITMFIQQKLNPPPADPTQKMILSWLPFIFVILFSGFAAGLVIYWTWSNFLSIIQQWVITNKLNHELKHQLRNLPTPGAGKK